MIGNSVEFVMYQLEVNDSGTYEFTADNGAEKKTLSIVIRIKGKFIVINLSRCNVVYPQ